MKFSDLAQAASASAANAIKFVDPLNAAMKRFGIDRSQRNKAMFISQVAIESWNLTKTEEDLYYKDPARMASLFSSSFRNAAEAAPYARNPKAFSQKRYQGYHGRGLIQLTWLDNYRACSNYFGIDYVSQPDLLLRPEDAAMSAAWYYAVFRPCLDLADAGSVTEVTRKINPALLHLAERKAQYEIAMKVAL